MAFGASGWEKGADKNGRPAPRVVSGRGFQERGAASLLCQSLAPAVLLVPMSFRRGTVGAAPPKASHVTARAAVASVSLARSQSGQGHSEAFAVITRIHFPDVALPHLTKVHASNSEDVPMGTPTPPAIPTDNAPAEGLVLRSDAVNNGKEAAAAEAELLDTLVGLVALRGGVGGVAPHGSGGLGAEGGSLGNGRYVARLSEGRESSGRAEEATLLNLLFVPEGR